MKRHDRPTLFMLIFVCFGFLGTLAGAEPSPMKHPRVAELETVVFDDATRFLQRRFPNLPIALTVAIDPLRRREGSRVAGADEKLPYYQLDPEEIADEWDDPNIPVRALMNRVKKVSLRVLLPSQVSETEVTEVQQNLLEVLNLVPARDQVQVEKRNWTVVGAENGETKNLLFWGGALLFAIFSLFGIARLSTSKLAGALKTSGGAAASTGSAGPAPSFASAPASKPAEPSGSDLLGDINFNDPLRLQQEVSEATRDISADPCFPNLKDIMTLDRIGQKNPAALGALLVEFPLEAQRRLFASSLGRHWLDAFVEPGMLSSESINTLRRMMKNQRDPADRSWQAVLLQVWRLNEHRVSFLKSLAEDETFAILSRLPKSLAVGTAREVFPGKWGLVLDSSYKAAEVPTARLDKIALQAQQIVPPRDFSLLEQYRSERELLEYLRLTDPQEEKEIYGASPSHSVIHTMRAPFYPFFELEKTAVEELVKKVPLDEWAMAMLNVPKSDRRILESVFSDKQRYLYIEKIKAFDSQQVSKFQIGAAREKIADFMASAKKERGVRDGAPAAADAEGGDHDANAA